MSVISALQPVALSVAKEEHYLLFTANPGKKRILKKKAVPSLKLPIRSHDRKETSPMKRSRESRKRRAEARSARANATDRFFRSRKLLAE